MKMPVPCKIVKTTGEGSATLTRLGNRVFAMKLGHPVFDKEFPTVSAAKRFMGSTLAV